MYTLQPVLAFAGTAIVLTMMPGLDTATVLRTSAVESPRHGALAAIGIGFGCLVWGSAVALGLGALLTASELAFTTVKYAGAAYLFWLGVRLLTNAQVHDLVRPETVPATRAGTGLAALGRGFTTNILNPKVGIFYVTLLPQFIPAGASTAGYAFLLTGVHVVLAILWFLVVAAGAGAIGRLLRHPRVLRRIDVATGCVFLGFGAKLMLAEQH